ncbi:MAG: hypothetical protein QW258_01775 [Thermoplasmata archaeon]
MTNKEVSGTYHNCPEDFLQAVELENMILDIFINGPERSMLGRQSMIIEQNNVI